MSCFSLRHLYGPSPNSPGSIGHVFYPVSISRAPSSLSLLSINAILLILFIPLALQGYNSFNNCLAFLQTVPANLINATIRYLSTTAILFLLFIPLALQGYNSFNNCLAFLQTYSTPLFAFKYNGVFIHSGFGVIITPTRHTTFFHTFRHSSTR